MKIGKFNVKIFKMKNRRGYAAICHDCLTEGSTKNAAYDRMVKAIRRVTRKKTKRGFTLMELLIVVVIVGVVASFGIPNYTKTVGKNRERAAIAQLIALHGANMIYEARNRQYLPGVGLNVAAINAGLNINIVPNGMTYAYTLNSPTTFTATATWAGSGAFTVGIDENPVDAGNPYCAAGSCQIAP